MTRVALVADRCTGACCEKFALTGIGRTVEEIRAFLLERGLDGPTIADMIVPLYPIEPGALAPNGETVVEAPQGGGWVFTCRHFTGGQCGIYERRPAMCREFPYGKPCEHGERCAWNAGRTGRWPPAGVRYEYLHEEGHGPGEARRRTHLRVVTEGA